MRFLKAYLWLFTLMTLSGMLLMFLYVPNAVSISPAASATQGLTAGYVLRGVHFWGANLAALAALGYLARTIFVKTNLSLIGLAAALALLTLMLGFSGYLLPWDHLALWMGSWLPGISPQNALLSVYWTHSLILPILTLPLLIGHVRRQRQLRSSSL